MEDRQINNHNKRAEFVQTVAKVLSWPTTKLLGESPEPPPGMDVMDRLKWMEAAKEYMMMQENNTPGNIITENNIPEIEEEPARQEIAQAPMVKKPMFNILVNPRTQRAAKELDPYR